MPTINLLPWREIERKKKVQSFIVLIFMAVIISLVIIAAAYFFVKKKIDDALYHNQVLQQNVREMDEAIKEIKNLQSLKGDLQKKLKSIDSLQQERSNLLQALEAFADNSMRNIRVDRLELSGNQVLISGAGDSTRDIANYIRELEKSKVFINPDLSNEGIRKKDSSGTNTEDKYAYAFTIEARFDQQNGTPGSSPQNQQRRGRK